MPVYREWFDDTKAFQIVGLWQSVVGLIPGATVGPVSQWIYNDKGGTRADTTTLTGYHVIAEASWDGGVNWVRSGPPILQEAWIEVAVTGIDNTGSAGMAAQATDYAKLGAGRSVLLLDIPKNCARRISYRVVVPLGAANAGLSWRLVIEPPTGLESWITPAFVAGDFLGSGSMTWTVSAADRQTFAYRLLDAETMVLAYGLNQTTTAGVASNDGVRMKIPAGRIAAQTMTSFAMIYEASSGTHVNGYCEVTANGMYVTVFKFSGAVYAISTDGLYIRGQIIFAVKR